MKAKYKNIITFSLIGVAAYMFADIIHEVVGHGGACLLGGYEIKLLTSVYFRSTSGSFITDLGGSISNLFFGFLIFIVLKQRKDIPILFRFLLLLMMAYNFFWFSGTILQSSFSKTGDWTYAIKELNIGTLGKPVLIVVGISAYLFFIKLIRTQFANISLYYADFPLQQSVYYSYFAAAIAAVIAGLFFMPERLPAAQEGLLEMIGALPILFTRFIGTAQVESYKTKSGLVYDVIIFILFIVFCLTLGRGFIF